MKSPVDFTDNANMLLWHRAPIKEAPHTLLVFAYILAVTVMERSVTV